jgi:hypothetical protein
MCDPKTYRTFRENCVQEEYAISAVREVKKIDKISCEIA